MRVVSSSLTLVAERQFASVTRREERLLAWVGERPGTETPPPPPAPPAPAHSDSSSDETTRTDAAFDRHARDLLLLLRTLGQDARRDLRALEGARQLSDGPAASIEVTVAVTAPAAPARAGWGVEYDLHEEHAEAETMRFEATGEVKTADGRTIDVQAQLILERARVETRSVSVRAGDARKVDPLVLNLNGAPAFAGSHDFDLDADGKTETIARLASGSAYLALDTNGNGAVDDGRELFGPRSGDGFGELAAHDSDGNGWIDEADPIWTELRLWTPDAKAPSTLAAAGVGAIALGSAASPFTLEQGNAAAGVVARTGIYLHEDGRAGTVQHIDLVA